MLTDDISQLSESELLELLDKEKLPRHVAIIMDGNGRWAQIRKRPRVEGHRASMASVRSAVETCGELGIEVLTLYAFSTENWNRPRREVNALMFLLREQLQKNRDELNEKNVQVRFIGQVDRLPSRVRGELENSVESTKNNTGLILNLAVSYGSRLEIVQAVQHIAQDVKDGKIEIEDICEEQFSNHLYTAGLPDLDLLIRTSGEMRLSNFLLWQLAYAELYVTPILWPDFRRQEFLAALISYQQRQRRFGGLIS